MKIILRQTIEKLGTIGDVVTVRDGYARNYLFPRNIAYPASKGALQSIEEEKRQYTRRVGKESVAAEELAKKLEGITVTITMQVGDEGRLFGAVTSQLIAERLRTQGFMIDKRTIELAAPIKELGKSEVTVKLAHGVKATLVVQVAAQ